MTLDKGCSGNLAVYGRSTVTGNSGRFDTHQGVVWVSAPYPVRWGRPFILDLREVEHGRAELSESQARELHGLLGVYLEQQRGESSAPGAYSHVVRDSGRRLHLERENVPGRAVCGQRVDGWAEKSALCWQLNPERRCANCAAPLGAHARLKP